MTTSWEALICLCLLVGLKVGSAQNVCPKDFKELNGRCFLFHDDTLSRDDAVSKCSSMGGSSLVAISDGSVQNAIENELRTSVYLQQEAWDYFWTGGKERSRQWYWSADERNIGPQGCYRITDDVTMDQVDARNRDGLVDPEECTQKCREKQENQFAAIGDPSNFGLSCFCLSNVNELSLVNALSCSRKCQTVPVNERGKGDSDSYRYRCGGTNQFYSLYSLYATNSFGRWTDNRPSDASRNEKCMSLGYGQRFEWIHERCYRKMRSICSIDTNDVNFCNSVGGSPYTYSLGTKCIYINQQPLNWFKAREACQQKRGNLVTISDPELYTELVDRVLPLGGIANQNDNTVRADFWIGGRKGQLLWNDRDQISYTSFANDEPRDDSGYSCISVSRHSNPGYMWDMRPCAESHPFICEAASIQAPTPTTPTIPPTPAPTPTTTTATTTTTKVNTTVVVPTTTTASTSTPFVSTTATITPPPTTTTTTTSTTTSATTPTPSPPTPPIPPSPSSPSPPTPTGPTVKPSPSTSTKPPVTPTVTPTPRDKTSKPTPTKKDKDKDGGNTNQIGKVSDSDSGFSMGPGVIAAIVVVAVAVLVVVIRLIVYCIKGRREDPSNLSREDRIAQQEKYLATYENAGFDENEGGNRNSKKQRDSYLSNGNGYIVDDQDHYNKPDRGSSQISESSETGEKERETSLIYAY